MVAAEELRALLGSVPDPLGLLTGVFQHLPVPLQIYERSGRSILVNKAFLDMYLVGPPPEYNVFRDHLAERIGLVDSLRRAFAGETVHLPPVWYDPRQQRQVTVHEGNRAAFESTFFPLRDAGGQVTHVAIVGQDVSARLLLQRKGELLDLAQRLAEIGSWEHDLDTDVQEWSAELVRLLELPEDTVPSTAARLSRVHPDDRERVERAERALVDGTRFELEYRLLSDSGEPRVVLARGERLPRDAGGPPRLVGTVQDVTERRRLRARMDRTERLASLGTLAAGVAHEINNPLSYVLMNADYALHRISQDGSGDLAGLEKALEDLRDGAERIRSIVRDLGLFTRGDEAPVDGADVNAAVRWSLSVAAGDLAARAAVVEALGEVLPVRAHEVRLGQVFLNLLVNAGQAVEEAGGPGHVIEVRSGVFADGRVFVEVKDSGVGMTPEAQRRIFDPFFTTKAIGSGTGVGLTVCHGIVSGLGGEIVVDSAPGKGSTFRVLLPASVAAEYEPPAVVAPAARRGRILVVDDDLPVALALQRILDDEHDVVVSTSGAEALQRLESGERFDLVLCDLMMPDVSGMQLHQRLSVSAPALVERVVFMTAGASTRQARGFLANTPNARLLKPVNRDELRALVNARLA